MPACTNCCIGCDIASDSFTTDLSAWTQVSGSWSVAGGQLVCATGIIVHNTTPMTEFDGVRVVWTPITASTTATVRLICAYTDTSNYLFGQFRIDGTAGYIRLGMVTGGSTIYLTDEVTVNDNTAGTLDDAHTMRLCWQPGTARTPHSSFSILTPISGTVEGSPDAALIECDAVTADFGLSNVTPTKGCQVTFSGGIPPGSTVDGIEYAVTVSSTQASTITGTVSFSAGAASGTSATFTVTDSLATYSGGSSTTPYSATWQDVNGLNGPVSVSASFTRATAPAGDVVSVDCLAITVHYTTPANTAGRLRLQYVNTIDGTTDCTGETQAYPPGSGLKTGLQVTAGTWFANDFDLDYLYSDSLHRTCTACVCGSTGDAGPCFVCCDNDNPPASTYTLDFGSGGWIGQLAHCADSNGEQACERVSGFIVVESFTECVWQYVEVHHCGRFGDQDIFDIIRVTLTLSLESGSCYWNVHVQVNSIPGSARYSWATYKSDALATTTVDCKTEPVTLTKTGEGGAPLWGQYCLGNLPDEITLENP